MPKNKNTTTIGGSEHTRSAAVEAAEKEVIPGGPIDVREGVRAEQQADEKKDASQAERGEEKKADEKEDRDRDQRDDAAHDQTRDEERNAARAWSDDMDTLLVRRVASDDTQAGAGMNRSSDQTTDTTRREEEDRGDTRGADQIEDARKSEERRADDDRHLDLDTSRDKQAEQERNVSKQGSEMLEQTHGATRDQWLQELRDEHPALAELDNSAVERVLQRADDLNKMRGLLVEELANNELQARAAAMGEDHEYIAGGRIHWKGHEQMDDGQWKVSDELTDGMILRPSQKEAGAFEVAAFAECKAGACAALGLEEKNIEFEELKPAQRTELERAAIDALRKKLGAEEADIRPGNWAHSDQLRENHREELDAVMKDMHGPDRTGQLRNDFERLMEHADDEDVAANVRARDAVSIFVDGQEKRVLASPGETKVFAVTPADVDTKEMLDRLQEEQRIQGESIQLGMTADEVTELAGRMQQAQQQYERNAAAHEEEMRIAAERDRQRLDEIANFADALRELDED